jgi:hypothetical protein
MTAPTRFCAAWLISLLGVLLFVGGFDLLIDPYDVFGTPRTRGLNFFKAATEAHTSLSKPYQIERIRPRTVLIGSSTVDIGLDPADPVWPADLRPVFDFGLPGSGPTSHYRALRHAAAAGPVQLAVIVLNFVDTLEPAPAPGTPPTRSETARRLLVTEDGASNPDRTLQRAKDAFLSTLTLDAFEDSLSTLLSQYQSDPLDLTRLGSTTEGAFRRAAATEGYAVLFREKEEEYARKFAKLSRQPRTDADLRYWVGIVGRMIEFCQDHEIRPILVIAPYHADMMELIESAGLWGAFEDWKVALTEIVQRSGPTAVLWDFTDYDQYSTEEVPNQPARSAGMRWFWEPVHFKKALGSKVLQRILTGEPEQFGTMLTPANVRAHLAEIRSARAAYLAGRGGTLRVREALSTLLR